MKYPYWFTLICLFFALNICSVFILFHSPARKWVQNHFMLQGKSILSVVQGDLMHDGSSIKVVKFKTIRGIVLEFYSDIQNGSRYLITRIEIPNAKDGFFDYRGQAVQLAVVDIDGDGKMELLSPTFDDMMLARLNPYHYSNQEEGFVPFILSDDKNR